MTEAVEKPWGSYQNILDEPYTKVKKVVIKSGESPSYQYHFKRSEIWVIVQGVAEVKLDDKLFKYGVGDIIQIEKEMKHQPMNVGDEDLIFVEIQLGNYFGEDDIVRLNDKYGRV